MTDSVEPAAAFYLGATPPGFKLKPLETHAELRFDSPDWKAQNFKHGIDMCFQARTNIRIQALTFNGETVFDYRLWPMPPDEAVLKPITLKVREPQIPEWKEKP